VGGKSRSIPFSRIYNWRGIVENEKMRVRKHLGIRTLIRRLLAGQKLGVLATLETRSSYQSLVAFAVSRDLRQIYFATEINTRKHSNLSRSPKVSMLFDNRSNAPADFFRGVAVTALGMAEEVKAKSRGEAFRLYLRKHPALDSFIKSPSCRMFQVKVKTYIVVTEFQRVRKYNPADRSRTAQKSNRCRENKAS
jgi:nitroimidazol reductase NimA-like FMN-containing flavoprotein (pyridoxamine 5'-phosphate oxidase superfamily)